MNEEKTNYEKYDRDALITLIKVKEVMELKYKVANLEDEISHLVEESETGWSIP
jgi:hypothetical protein